MDNIRLTILMESRIHGDMYVRFGGEYPQSYHGNVVIGGGCLAYGIYIPGSLEMNAAKEIVANMGNSVGTSFTMTQSTGAQLTSDLSKGAIQGVSAYMQKKIRQVKVTLKSGYRVMLMPKAN